MRYILTAILCVTMCFGSWAQKSIQDIKVFNQWSSYDHKNKQWKEWKTNDEVFILNYKESKNIARCRLNKEIIIYKRDADATSKQGKSSDGYTYTSMKAKDGYLSLELRFFNDNPNYQMELLFGSIRMRFRKTN